MSLIRTNLDKVSNLNYFNGFEFAIGLILDSLKALGMTNLRVLAQLTSQTYAPR